MDNWYSYVQEGNSITDSNWNQMVEDVWCQGGISGSYIGHSGNTRTAHNLDVAVSSQNISGGTIKGTWAGSSITSGYITGYIASSTVVTNYMQSSVALTNFANSSSINSRFVASGVMLKSVSSQAIAISGGSNTLFIDPTANEPSKLAGMMWMSGTSDNTRLYMCTANAGNWFRFDLTLV